MEHNDEPQNNCALPYLGSYHITTLLKLTGGKFKKLPVDVYPKTQAHPRPFYHERLRCAQRSRYTVRVNLHRQTNLSAPLNLESASPLQWLEMYCSHQPFPRCVGVAPLKGLVPTYFIVLRLIPLTHC